MNKLSQSIYKFIYSYSKIYIVSIPVTKNKFRAPLEFVIMRLHCSCFNAWLALKTEQVGRQILHTEVLELPRMPDEALTVETNSVRGISLNPSIKKLSEAISFSVVRRIFPPTNTPVRVTVNNKNTWRHKFGYYCWEWDLHATHMQNIDDIGLKLSFEF